MDATLDAEKKRLDISIRTFGHIFSPKRSPRSNTHDRSVTTPKPVPILSIARRSGGQFLDAGIALEEGHLRNLVALAIMDRNAARRRSRRSLAISFSKKSASRSGVSQRERRTPPMPTNMSRARASALRRTLYYKTKSQRPSTSESQCERPRHAAQQIASLDACQK